MLIKKINVLPLNLQFFAADNPGGGEPQNTDPNPESPADDNPSNPTKQDEQKPQNQNEYMIPKSRFDEVNNKYKAVKEQLDELLNKKKEEELQKQKEKGEFEELYNKTSKELESYKNNFETTKTRVEELEGVINSMLETKLESIPEEFHDLIPEHLSPEQKLDWISKAEAKGLFKDNSQEPVGGSTNPAQKQTDLSELNPMQLLSMGYGKQK